MSGVAVAALRSEARPAADADGLPHDRPEHRAGVEGGGAGQAEWHRSPWGNSWFWLLQVLILATALVRLALVVRLGLSQASPIVEYSTLVLFLPLTTVAALAFGGRGAAFSSAWTTILCLPSLIDALAHPLPGVALAETVQLLLLIATATATGLVVDRERNRRRHDQRALDEAAHAIAVYRDLFDSNTSPILVIDGEGTIVDANAAAAASFGDRVATSGMEASLPGGHGVPRARLIDVVGADAAGQILAAFLSARWSSADLGATAVPLEADGETGVTVEVPVGGRPTLFRLSTSLLARPDGPLGMQVVLHDVTEERRERELLEAFAAQLLAGQEEERKRISQDLHDSVGQNLSAVKYSLERAALLLRREASEDAGAILDASVTRVRRVMDEVRSISMDLRPALLDHFGAASAVRDLCRDWQSVYRSISVETQIAVSDEDIPAELVTNVFRA
ncbi:MAG: PAS domain-containing protein, partial [Acidimicrobiales bacterium]|nr:PAS domain-containing protein [Acidimicrobiales bacterium]